MSVMLRTQNPEAAEEADPGKDTRRPYVGQVVIYHCRPGEGRSGKQSSPAIVKVVEDDDNVELEILFDADDKMTRWKIPRRTEQNPFNSWSFNEFDHDHYRPGPVGAKPPEPTHLRDLKEAREQIQELRNRVTELERKHKGGK